LNPDHDRLGSFKTDFIKNEAVIRFVANPGPGATYTLCTWRDGKVVDAQGQVVFDSRLNRTEPNGTTPAGKK
jgi:hypothetical protein